MDYEVQFVERGEREARFVARPMTPAFANGIRRAMLADVPTLSVDDVRVIENSSVMFDEQIALRLGLVPLTTPPNEFEIGDTVTISLDVSGPSRESPEETRTAYSGDIVSNDGMVEPADENIPVIDLKADQRLQVEADAVLDVGREHAKHQGGVAVGYRHLQRVEDVGERGEFDDDDTQVIRGVIEEAAPEHADGEANEGELVATEAFDHNLRNRYPGRELSVSDVENAFVFDVETDGSLSADELVGRAVGSLEARGRELKEAVQL
jgi:DNA-directed RNA polymerase, subunit D (EC 2.7.7.6)